MSDENLYEFPPMLGPAEEFPVGSADWALRISNRLQINTRLMTRNSVPHVIGVVEAIFAATTKPWDIWPDPPFKTPNDYCLAVTGHKWATLLSIVDELRDKDVNENLFGLGAAMRAELAKAQVEHRPQGAHHKNLKVKPGETSEYLLRRLARERPDILSQYERGEFKSVRAAAKAASLIKQPSPFEQIERLVSRLLPQLTADERAQLRAMLAETGARRPDLPADERAHS